MDPHVWVSAVAEEGEDAGGNFLVPNGTILFELLAFLLILFILGRFVVPPIQRAMRQRQEMVQQGIDDAQQARERAEAAQRAQREELDEARTEGAKIRERARAEADRLAGEKRQVAADQVAAEHERGEAELNAQRAEAARELRGQVGGLAVTLAERILGSDPTDDPTVRARIDSFLQDLPEDAAADSSARGPVVSGAGASTPGTGAVTS